MRFPRLGSIPSLLLALLAHSAQGEPSQDLKPFVKEDAPVLVLEHVRLIDGTGAAPLEDMRIDIAGGKIASVQTARVRTAYPAKARVLDLTGRTVIPGLVGMHEHLFYPLPGGKRGLQVLFGEMADSAPRLYLAAGVTTARTAGSIEPYTDLSIKQRVDSGKMPGPKLRITGPYLGDVFGYAPQLHALTDTADAARTVDYWAAEGVTSIKAYLTITRDQLQAAVEHAHARGIKITGHLCAVGFREAAALGIDNLEHGIVVDSEFFPGKKPDQCPQDAAEHFAKNVEIDSPPVQEMIRDLVMHKVAITSTLAVFEVGVPGRPLMAREVRAQELLTETAWAGYLKFRAVTADAADPTEAALLRKEMQFERAFVKAGGLLVAGCDPTLAGGVLPGYGDQRNLELLVEAGFTAVEAIHIATQNGAVFLGEGASTGTVAPGKAADLVVVNGNPAARIDDVENVETVFKDGVGYDPAKLRDSVRGLMGLR